MDAAPTRGALFASGAPRSILPSGFIWVSPPASHPSGWAVAVYRSHAGSQQSLFRRGAETAAWLFAEWALVFEAEHSQGNRQRRKTMRDSPDPAVTLVYVRRGGGAIVEDVVVETDPAQRRLRRELRGSVQLAASDAVGSFGSRTDRLRIGRPRATEPPAAALYPGMRPSASVIRLHRPAQLRQSWSSVATAQRSARLTCPSS
jgi:hypothetical protein